MASKLRIIGVILFSALLLAGWDFHPKASATIPDVNEMISIGISGAQSNAQGGGRSSVSGDGRYVAFFSNASNLVANDTNGKNDVFVRDTTNQTTVLVSVSSSGVQGNNGSGNPTISYDGRYVAFESSATNLVSGDTNGHYDVFVHDMQTGTTMRASVSATGAQGDQDSTTADMSADGRFVTFVSYSSTLVSGFNPYGYGQQAFLKDMYSGSLKAISATSTGGPGNARADSPKISCDGGIIVFGSSATNLVSGDTNGHNDVFVYSNTGNAGVLTNITLSANGATSPSGISCDGNKISMNTSATNLTPNSPTFIGGIIEFNRLTNVGEVVSANSSDVPTTSGSGEGALSGDGRYVVFVSDGGTSLDASRSYRIDYSNVFIRDMKAHTTQVLSIDRAGRGAGTSALAAISADGTYVTYQTAAEEQTYDPSTAIVVGDKNGFTDTVGSQTGFNP